MGILSPFYQDSCCAPFLLSSLSRGHPDGQQTPYAETRPPEKYQSKPRPSGDFDRHLEEGVPISTFSPLQGRGSPDGVTR